MIDKQQEEDHDKCATEYNTMHPDNKGMGAEKMKYITECMKDKRQKMEEEFGPTRIDVEALLNEPDRE